MRKADEHQHYLNLTALLAQLETQAQTEGRSGYDRITRELRDEVEAIRQSFDRAQIEAKIATLGLYGDDD